MPLICGIAGPNAARLTFDISEPQVLESFPHDHFQEHHRVLLLNLGEGRWILATPTLDVYLQNMTTSSIRPLRRGHVFPPDGRPFFVFSDLSAAEWADLRSRARALAGVLGLVPIAAATAATDSKWLFADTAIEEFGTEVPAGIFADAATHVQDNFAIVSYLTPAGARFTTVAETVLDTEKDAWISAKREGAGRDPRLSSLTADATAPLPTFREAWAAMRRCTTTPDAIVFKGPSAMCDVGDAIVATGLEPAGFHAAWEKSSGVNPRSAICLEHLSLLMALVFLACRDRMDLYRLHAAEHIARRLLQIERAVRKCPKAPDFEGLAGYSKHVADPGGALSAPSFDAHIAATQKDEAFHAKQSRLAAEEAELKNKNRNKNNKNKNQKDEE